MLLVIEPTEDLKIKVGICIFLDFSCVFERLLLLLQRSSYVQPSFLDVRLGGILHNLKASSMLCSVAV